MLKTLSPARTKLRGLREKLDEAIALVDAANRPLLGARDRLHGARADAREANAELERARAAEAAGIIDGKDLKRLTAEVERAQVAADRCARVVDALESKVRELEAGVAELHHVARGHAVQVEVAVNAVLAEMGEDALRCLKDARAVTVRSEEAVRSIAAALIKREDFKRAEVINVARNKMPWPEGMADAAPFLALAERLSKDASATMEGIR